MCPLQLFTTVLTIILMFSQFQFGEAARTKRAAVVENCECEGLKCTCCVVLDSNRGCLEATYDPNELTLYANFLANGQSVYSTKIDSGDFPICASVFPLACWAFNRVHIDRDTVQVCSEVRIGPVPILKVPCLAYAGGNLIASPNTY